VQGAVGQDEPPGGVTIFGAVGVSSRRGDRGETSGMARDNAGFAVGGCFDDDAEIWLYGMAEFGYATDDDVPGLLAAASSKGCKIQVLP
jgi:hypothetical protein